MSIDLMIIVKRQLERNICRIAVKICSAVESVTEKKQSPALRKLLP